MILRGGAIAAALVLTSTLAWRTAHFAPGLLALGLLGTGLLASGTARRTAVLVAVGVLALGSEAIIRLATAASSPGGTALVGVALLVVAEAGFLTAELRPEQVLEPGALASRAWRVGAVAGGGLLLGVACLAVAGVELGASVALQALGALAAVLVAVLLSAARDAAPPEPPR